jgi:hypothetical protein
MEKILMINEEGFTIQKANWKDHYEGYNVVTDQQIIKVGISSGQCCCENYGYLTTNDDINEFIGANLLSISITDQALNNKKIEELEYLDCGDTMFVNIETSKGLLQLVAYNSHNGYYGHNAVLISKQVNHEVCL